MAKRRIGPIEGAGLRLRLLEEVDLPLTRGWRNQDDIRKWFVHSDAVTLEQHRRWFEQYASRDDDFVFVIEETRELRKAVGQISLYRIDWERRRAEYGRLLIGEPDARGKGLAREATSLLLEYAFTRLGLKEIELEVFRDNLPAIAIYRACGFAEIGEQGGLIKMAIMAG